MKTTGHGQRRLMEAARIIDSEISMSRFRERDLIRADYVAKLRIEA